MSFLCILREFIMTKADWLDFLKPLMVVQQLKKKLQQHLQQVSFKMTHQQLKRRLFKKHQHNQSLQGLNQLQSKECQIKQVRPQAGFAEWASWSASSFANGQPSSTYRSKYPIYQWPSCSCSSPTISICNNFQKLLDRVALMHGVVQQI